MIIKSSTLKPFVHVKIPQPNGQRIRKPHIVLAQAMFWGHDGRIVSPGGCSLVPPRRLQSGQFLEIAPVGLEEKFFVVEQPSAGCWGRRGEAL